MLGVNQGERVRLFIKREDTSLTIADIGKYFSSILREVSGDILSTKISHISPLEERNYLGPRGEFGNVESGRDI